MSHDYKFTSSATVTCSHATYLRVSTPRSVVQRSEEFTILRVEICTTSNELIHRREITVTRCDLKHSVAYHDRHTMHASLGGWGERAGVDVEE